MTYSRKFARMVLALEKGKEQKFSEKAAELNLKRVRKEKTDKAVFFELLRECTAIGVKQENDFIAAPTDETEMITRRRIVNIFLDKLEYKPSGVKGKKKLVDPEEAMFVFLWENAASMQLEKSQREKLDDIIQKFLAAPSDVLPVAEVNWKIAQIIYDKLKEAKNKEATLAIKILIGYLINSPSFVDITAEVEKLKAELPPITFVDYLAHRVAIETFESNPTGKKFNMGLF